MIPLDSPNVLYSGSLAIPTNTARNLPVRLQLPPHQRGRLSCKQLFIHTGLDVSIPASPECDGFILLIKLFLSDGSLPSPAFRRPDEHTHGPEVVVWHSNSTKQLHA